MQTWELYERRELVGLVDISLNGDFDAEEACKILTIGLLCTQDTPKLRPTMSTVVKMLTGEMDVDESKITKPGLISDVMDLKIREPKNNNIDNMETPSSYNASSTSDSQGGTTTMSSLAASSASTTTFTAKFDQSM